MTCRMRYLIILAVLTITVTLSLVSADGVSAHRFHSETERTYFKNLGSVNDSALIDGRNALFASVGECSGCHGTDLEGIASVNAAGEDINVVDDWRATMMAMSAKDPFWRAKVSHESLVNSNHVEEIESSCTDCHAPLGFYNAMHLGLPHYTMADLKLDSVALDGVSCGACHQISPEGVGTTFSGIDIQYDEDIIYGQYEDPFAGPMQSFVGFLPVYSDHIEKSEVCASCHTLITETFGIDGEPNGQEFVEQATYHEWVNSAYNSDDESALQCQGCHMTQVNDDVVIAANLLFLEPRSPFFRHDIVGGNSFMLEMMKEHRDTLDLRANASHFDTIIDRTNRMLQYNTLDISLMETERTEDFLTVDLLLTNKAGHKFPSAYPSRIAFVQLIALNANGDTLFSSGLLDEEYEIIGRDIPFEPHYDLITSEDEVQVYELVIADELGEETTVLSQAQDALKDNRLVPLGFTSTHFAYDTTMLYGQVLNDDDFNLYESGEEGTGKDLITYVVPINGYEGQVTVSAQVYYQVTPPRWLEEMLAFSSDDIDHFNTMYEGADKDPVLVGSDQLISGNVGLEIAETLELQVFPNPTKTGEVAIHNLKNRSIDKVSVFDSSGSIVQSERVVRGNTVYVSLPDASGVYIIRVESEGIERAMQVLRL